MDDHNNNNNNNIYNNNSISIDSSRDSLNNNFSSINSISNNNNFNSIISTDNILKSNDNIENNNCTKSHSKIWKIATQNIRGINSELKQQNWWNFCIENSLDIIAITKTKLIK